MKLTQPTVVKILELLRNSDLTIAAIAKRFQVGITTVLVINRRHGVRVYGGKHTAWTVDGKHWETPERRV